MSGELKPCPFCGGEAEIERVGDHSQSTIYACTFCGCRLETGEEFNHGAAWNTRTPVPPLDDVEVRARILEEAAKVADGFKRFGFDRSANKAAHETAQQIAAAIRALPG